MDITAEITVKFRLAIKSKLRAMKIEEDDDLIDFIMIIFARKKRFEAIKEDLEELLEEKTADFAVWLDLLIQKVNGLQDDPSREFYVAKKRKEKEELEERLEAEEDAREAAREASSSDSDSEADSRDRSRSRSRSTSPPKNRINIFLEDTRKIHEIRENFEDLKRKSRRLNKEFSKREDKNSKRLSKSYKGINEGLMKLQESCDALELDTKDTQNRADRKKLIKNAQKLLDRNDKALSFLMELYFIDCIWILLTIAGVAITSPKIITNNTLFQQLTTFGKTRVKSFRFDVPKSWFSHFYLLGTCFLAFLLYRWCLGKG